MSDILIKNIGTLKEPTPITLYPNGYWKDYTTGESGEFVGLPTSHGRLIDADALLASENQHYEIHSDSFYVETRTIELAPTIIESEGT